MIKQETLRSDFPRNPECPRSLYFPKFLNMNEVLPVYKEKQSTLFSNVYVNYMLMLTLYMTIHKNWMSCTSFVPYTGLLGFMRGSLPAFVIHLFYIHEINRVLIVFCSDYICFDCLRYSCLLGNTKALLY